MVIFSFLLMILVLFFRQGIMGQKELSWDMIESWFKRRKGLHKKEKVDKGGTI